VLQLLAVAVVVVEVDFVAVVDSVVEVNLK
jgi:hypothetical protein